MCLSHGMRRRSGNEGGFRSLVFLDSIDKIRRLHAAYDDAETQKRLATYRTRRYPDDTLTGAPRDDCCNQPHGCDSFRDGECWYVAATDAAQRGASGRHKAGGSLRVARQPVLSGATGRSEDLIRSEEHTSELQSLMRISYAVFCLKKKKHK